MNSGHGEDHGKGHGKKVGMTILQYEAIFLDFDGVLVESTEIKSRAFRSLYREFGTDVVERVMRHHRSNEGISRLDKISYCHKEFLDVELTERDLAALGRRYSSVVEDEVVACDWVAGAREFLERHHLRAKLFVASGTPERELKCIVDRRAMGGYFAGVHGSPRRKDAIATEALHEHGLDADKALFIGDAMADFHAAQAVGLDFIGRVPAGRDSPFPEGTATVADLTIFAS